MNQTELNVQGMTCGACVRHVTAALQPLPGVHAVSVDLAGGRVRVEGEADPAQLVTALQQAGYPAQVQPGTGSAEAPARTGCGGSRCCCG